MATLLRSRWGTSGWRYSREVTDFHFEKLTHHSKSFSLPCHSWHYKKLCYTPLSLLLILKKVVVHQFFLLSINPAPSCLGNVVIEHWGTALILKCCIVRWNHWNKNWDPVSNVAFCQVTKTPKLYYWPIENMQHIFHISQMYGPVWFILLPTEGLFYYKSPPES